MCFNRVRSILVSKRFVILIVKCQGGLIILPSGRILHLIMLQIFSRMDFMNDRNDCLFFVMDFSACQSVKRKNDNMTE